MYTNPTGFVLLAPAGPAMPVMLKPNEVPAIARIFLLIAVAVSLDTAPLVVRVPEGTLKSDVLNLLLYAVMPR